MLLKILHHFYQFCELYVVVLSWCVIPLAAYALYLFMKHGAQEHTEELEATQVDSASAEGGPREERAA